MKVVYTILGTFNSGGMERVLANKANYFARKGYDVIIFTTDQRDRKPNFKLDSNIKCIDLEINYTDTIGKGVVQKVFSYFLKQKKHFKALERELFRLKPDIVISMFDNDASLIHKIKDGSKKVLEIHFSRFKRMQYGRTGLLRFIDTYRSQQDLAIAKKYDRFVVLTEEDKSYWGSLHNIEVIPNSNSFLPKGQASLENKMVLAVGRFDYQKGFDDLIKVWSQVNKSKPEWILNIFGQGPMKDELIKLIADLGLDDVVFLHEPTKDIEQVYLDHSILAMTSRYEGLPMVLLEAQACGLPLVSYACKCGPSDIISNNGILVEEGNIEKMAQSLIELMNNDNLRKQQGANSKLNSQRYNEDDIMSKWIVLFDRLVNLK